MSHKNLALLITAGFLLLFGFLGFRWYRDWLDQENRSRLAENIGVYTNSIESLLARRLDLLDELVNFAQDRDEAQIRSDFPLFAAGLTSDTEGIRRVSLTKNGSFSLIYPLGESEDSIADKGKLTSTKDAVVTDPFEAPPGGLAIIGRKAIRKDGRFWGYASVVINIPSIISYSGLEKAESKIALAIRDSRGNTFWGDDRLFSRNPVITTVYLGDNSWQVAALPLGGFENQTKISLYLFVLITTLFGILILLLVNLTLARSLPFVLSEEKMADRNESARIAITYVIIGGAWILFSDQALAYFVRNPELFIQLQTIKGWFYVLATGLILFWLINTAFERYQVTNRALKSILAGNNRISSAKSEKELLQGICEEIVKQGYLMAWVVLTDKDGSLKPAAIAGVAFAGFPGGEKEIATGPVGIAVKSEKAIIIQETSSQYYRSVMAVPLKENGVILGALAIYSRYPHSFSEGDLKLMTAFATEIVAGVRRFRSIS